VNQSVFEENKMKQRTASRSRTSLQTTGIAFMALLMTFTGCNNNSRGSSQTSDQKEDNIL
jgi:hypothetical protein